jgi:anti-sigma-K factor RskA
MKLENSTLRQMLAGEYVLGSLRGRARMRFERLMHADAALRRLVDEWQQDLSPLAQETPAVAPPRVLEAVQGRIGRNERTVGGFWNRVGFWRRFSFGSAAVAVALAVFTTLLVLRPPAAAAPSYVAVLQSEAGQPALVVTGYRNPFRIKTEPLAIRPLASGQVLQIWAIEKDTGAVQPLAAAKPDAPAQIALSDQAWKLVRNAHSLAISVEPAGAVATSPTSSLIYSGLCINLKGG